MKGDRIEYSEINWKYKLTKTYTISTPILGCNGANSYLYIGKDGSLTIYRGYAWNGANVIRDTEHNMRASLVHDSLYQLIGLGIVPPNYKKEADQVFYDIMLEDEENQVFAKICYEAVRKFGGSSCVPGSKDKKVFTAP